MAWIMDGALALWQWSQIYNIQQWKLRSPKVTSYPIHDERITRNGHKQAALVGRGGSLVYGAEARRQSHCENIQYPDSNPLMKFRKRLPNINSKSRPNTLLTPFIAPAMLDPDNVCPIMECPALKVNRAISMIVSVNIVKNIHVASAMKRHSTSEASFCYQSKETTVPPPPSSRMAVHRVSDFTICVRGAFETVHRLWPSSELRCLEPKSPCLPAIVIRNQDSWHLLVGPAYNFWYLEVLCGSNVAT